MTAHTWRRCDESFALAQEKKGVHQSRQVMDAGIEFIRDLMIILLAATAGGWAARRLRLSPVVGYLAAGLVIGTPEITFIYVTDPDRIQVLSQVGLVLLMFAIGTGIRLRQVRQLGAAPIVATILSALLVLSMGRVGGDLLGLDKVEALFFAAMLMVSSSAIIGKILAERHSLHQRFGQLALSQTLLEDFVAVVMLAVLGSVAAFGDGSGSAGAGILQSLGKLAGFVLLVFLTGLVILPRAMSRVHERSGEEMHILLAGGLVFAFAFLSVMAGYSLALGAFLFGMLVAETAHKQVIARSFSGMRDIFAAIFFVAIGMSIDLSQLPEALDLILWGSVIALLGRMVCITVAWMAACETAPVALRTALHLTPIGEFSFIIAGFGVASGILPERFQVAAVGIAFVTSVLAPLLMSQADRAIRLAGLDKPGRLAGWMTVYRGALARFAQSGRHQLLWKFLKKRLWQIGREVAWATAVMVFAQPVYLELERITAPSEHAWLAVVLPWFWMGIFVLLLIPVVSLIRNIQALAMLVADYTASQSPLVARMGRSVTFLLQGFGFLLLLLILGNVVPWWLFEPWTFLALLAVSLIVMVAGWNRLIRLHSQAEVLIQEAFDAQANPIPQGWQTAGQTWGLVLEECLLPENFSRTGQTIGTLGLRQRTGATVIGIERQGVALDQPGPGTHLFAGDKVFLIGRQGELQKALEILRQAAVDPSAPQRDLSHAILDSVTVPPGSPVVGKRLLDLNWPRLLGVHVVAARIGQQTVFSPGAEWVVPAEAELLLAGSPKALIDVKVHLT